MARQAQFRESGQEAFLLLHNMMGLLTKVEETTYSNQAGISYPQFLILITVESSEPPVSQTTISKKIQRNLNTISMIVDRMEKLGLVKRVRSEEDRRETHVSLTPLGKEKLAKAIKVGAGLKERLSGALTDEDLEQCMRLMAKFRDQILKEMGREPIPLESGRTSRRRIIEVFKKNLNNPK